MKRDEWLESAAVKRVALYAPCCDCRCEGFRPWIEGTPANYAKNNGGLFYFDLLAYDEYNLLERCMTCDHELRDHTNSVLMMDRDDVEYYSKMVFEAFTLNNMMLNELSRDKKRSLQYVYEYYNVALKKAVFSEERLEPLPDSNSLPNPSPTASEVMVMLIKAIAPVKEDQDLLFKLGSSFLSVFNKWEPTVPELFDAAANEMAPLMYRLIYNQWFQRVYLPQKLSLLNQHEFPELYGARCLCLFAKVYEANTPENKKTDPICVMASEIHKNRIILMEAVSDVVVDIPEETIPYYKHKENREPIGEGSPLFEKPESNEESFNHQQMLALLARIVEMERNGIFDTDKFGEDKFAADVAKAEIVKQEVDAKIVRFVFVKNEINGMQSHADLAWLVQLKTLFNAQLPKMGAEYITRLVFDPYHCNLALIRNCKVIGGCCFRPFPDRKFIEIVFLAVSSHDQIKGYGTIVMNYMKDYAVKKGMLVLLTFADSFATGYFKKQGFTNEIECNKDVYQGFIKEYEGATLMACQLHPMIRYVTFAPYIKACRDMHAAIHGAANPCRSKVYFGLQEVLFQRHTHKGRRIPIKDIPGADSVRNSGVKIVLPDDPVVPDLVYRMKKVLYKLRENENAWPFLDPVNHDDVPEYHDYVQFPSDFSTMDKRIHSGYYIHQRLFLADLCRIFSNCYSFNGNDTEYYRCGFELNKYACKLVDENFPGTDVYPVLPNVEAMLPVLRELQLHEVT